MKVRGFSDVMLHCCVLHYTLHRKLYVPLHCAVQVKLRLLRVTLSIALHYTDLYIMLHAIRYEKFCGKGHKNRFKKICCGAEQKLMRLREKS